MIKISNIKFRSYAINPTEGNINRIGATEIKFSTIQIFREKGVFNKNVTLHITLPSLLPTQISCNA